MVSPVPGQEEADERKAPRFLLSVEVAIGRELHLPRAATLIDVSQSDCRLVSDRSILPGTLVSITGPSFLSFQGWVAWSQRSHFGIDFTHGLPIEVVEHIALIGDEYVPSSS